jgi:hypothetical protein
MARIEESINIKCPVDKVFAYTTDTKSVLKWQTTITEAEQTSPGQMGVGTTIKGANRMMGWRTDWTATVTEYELNKRWSKNVVTGMSVIEDYLLFEPIEEDTKFTMVWDIKMSGFFKLLSPLVVTRTRKGMKKNLSNLKCILEAQT